MLALGAELCLKTCRLGMLTTTHIVAVMKQFQLSPRRMSSAEQPDAAAVKLSLMTPAVHDYCSRCKIKCAHNLTSSNDKRWPNHYSVIWVGSKLGSSFVCTF